jgi:hypothetical protein
MVFRISACEGIQGGQLEASPWQLLAGAVEAGAVDGAAIAAGSGSRDATVASSVRVSVRMLNFCSTEVAIVTRRMNIGGDA